MITNGFLINGAIVIGLITAFFAVIMMLIVADVGLFK